MKREKPSPTAEKITRSSRSNLAFAFFSLTRDRRRDITIFYAFCRLIDDIADSPEVDPIAKAEELEQWRTALHTPLADESPLAHELRGLFDRYAVTPAMLEEIIDGVKMDLTISRYDTWEALREYCYRVASAVGLVSIEIFGYRNPACKEYALQLGLALQLTNILRDVAKDLAKGRIYLPREEMERYGYAASELEKKIYNPEFVGLMQFEADRAHQFYATAAAALPSEDRRSMISAEIMAAIYRAILGKMERDRFRVFERSYGLGTLTKSLHAARQLLKVR